MRIDYLGPLRVAARGGEAGGEVEVEVRGRRLAALLVRLAMAPGRPVPVDLLADAVWPDGAPADPANALQSLVSRLRRALGEPAAVEQTPAGYRLAVDAQHVDAVRFATLAARGRALLAGGDAAAAAGAFREALALWRGEPMPEAGDATDLEAERAALRERRLVVGIERVEADLRAGADPSALARELDELALALPLREDVAALRLRALLDAGRPAQALLAFEQTRLALADTLGTDPSPALRALHLEALRSGEEPDAAGAATPTTLRRPVTSFLGRDDDVRTLTKRLGTDRLVTLTGTGGAGKTRLATEVAARVLDGDGLAPAVPDGVWFVELAPVTDPADLVSAVLDGLGVRDVAERTGLETPAEPRRRPRARERLLEELGARSCLVVLDNCEHLVAAAADLAAEVLARAPGVRLLATSREPLGVDGEVVHPLSPLAVPGELAGADEVLASPAVRLLLDRAAAAGAQVADADAGDLAAIVRRLDGLPLALELAAARLRLLSPSEVAARLDDRFRLLTGGRRTAVPRHRTLRAVVEWSWDLLTDVEREVADHFCVFPGGATPAAVAAVCPTWRDAAGTDEDAALAAVTDVLQGLVDKSLLVADHGPDGTRLRMLETLREYGAERLAAQELAGPAHDAAARHTAALVSRTDVLLRGPGQARALRVLDAERENVAAALAHLADRGDAPAGLDLVVHLGWYWLLREQAEDALRWSAAMLRLPGATADPAAPPVRALRVALRAAVPGVEPEDGGVVSGMTDGFAEAADMLAGADESYAPVRVLRPLLLFFAERRDEALALMAERIDTDPDPWVRAGVRGMRIAFAENDGELDQMRADVEAGVREWTALGDPWGLAAVLSSRGQLRTLDGDLDGAAADFEEAQRLLRVLGTASSDDVLMRIRLADLHLRAGDLVAARANIEAVRRGRSPGELEPMRGVLAEAMEASVVLAEHSAEQDAGAALATRERLLTALLATGRPSPFQAHATAVGYAGLAALDLLLGDRAAAGRHVREAYRHGVSTNDLPILAAVALAVAAVALDAGRPLVAAQVLGAAARLRGADDPHSPWVRRLAADGRQQAGEQAWDDAYAAGRALGRAEAIARLDPDLLEEAGVASVTDDAAGQARRR